MTVEPVEEKIRHALRMIGEWNEADLPDWPEVHIRYAIVDPIIRALGWNTEDPKECHPEYPRRRGDRNGSVDYALFNARSVREMAEDGPPPVVMIETKALKADLGRYSTELSIHMRASPEMTRGIAVLTNGRRWRFYDAAKPGRLPEKLICEIDLKEDTVRHSAGVLTQHIGKDQTAGTADGASTEPPASLKGRRQRHPVWDMQAAGTWGMTPGPVRQVPKNRNQKSILCKAGAGEVRRPPGEGVTRNLPFRVE